jgi:hypothetical protein
MIWKEGAVAYFEVLSQHLRMRNAAVRCRLCLNHHCGYITSLAANLTEEKSLVDDGIRVFEYPTDVVNKTPVC